MTKPISSVRPWSLEDEASMHELWNNSNAFQGYCDVWTESSPELRATLYVDFMSFMLSRNPGDREGAALLFLANRRTR